MPHRQYFQKVTKKLIKMEVVAARIWGREALGSCFFAKVISQQADGRGDGRLKKTASLEHHPNSKYGIRARLDLLCHFLLV